MSEQKQTVMADILPPKPRKPRVVTDPTKAEWVVRATNAEIELKRVTVERDNAVAMCNGARELTSGRLVALVALFAVAAFVTGVVAGWAVWHG